MIIIGNIIALLASLLMVYSGLVKEKKKILYVQNIQMGLFVVSNLVLGGFAGAIMNVIGVIRNLLCYHERFGLKEKIIITILSVALTILFNNLGIIGYLPLLAVVPYTWLLNLKDVTKFKILIIFTVILWAIYDFIIKSYTSFAFDLFTIVTNVYAIIIINKTK